MTERILKTGQRTLPWDEHPCPCRKEHAPRPPWTHKHHIYPLVDGGADTPDNIAVICPVTHDWVHLILRVFKRSGGLVNRERGWPHYAYDLAVEGWDRMHA